MTPQSNSPRTKWLRYGLLSSVGALLMWIVYAIFGGSIPRAESFSPPTPRPGIHSVAEAVQAAEPGLKVYVFYTGDIQVGGEAMLDPRNPKVRPDEMKKQFVPAMAYLIRHPTKGDVLFDTGFGPAFVGQTNGDLGSWTRPLMKTHVGEGQDLSSQLMRLGVNPRSLKYVILSHGHVDHTAGLPALGPVTVLMGKGEPEAIARPFSLLHGYKQAHFGQVGRLLEVDFDHAPVLTPLSHAVDLFGDGSIFLIDARGHTPGHLSLLVNLGDGPMMLAGDTVQTRRALADAIPSGNSTNPGEAREAAERLLTLAEQFPHLRIFYGHDRGDALLAQQHPHFYQ